jgi:DNA-binding response OmpR family regulator
VNDILDIEKIESGKMVFNLKLLDLLDVVKQALESNRAYGEQFGVSFVLQHDPADADIRINADPDRLLQVFANLLSNAAKFSPRGSSVKVSITRHECDVHISVRDEGSGIPEAFRPYIFQKFAQADSSATRQKGGTGLGLSITRAIVEKLGGAIWFETETDVGTTFSFSLPIWEVVVDHTSTQPRVLICEDTPDLASLLSVVLSHGGFSTDIAYNTEQARQLLAYNYYDAMTLDLLMPGQDGISFIRELRSHQDTRHLPIVVVSALAQQGRQQLEGGAFGVADWLEKPIDHERLIASLKQAMRQQTGVKSRVLHVEDDADVLQVIALVLRDIATVSQACTLEDARQRLQKETFDLLLLDMSLPDGSGLELLSFLQEVNKRSLPIVIFSAREVSKETAHHVAATLVKSRTSNQELLDIIQSLIHRRHADRSPG